MDVTVIIDELNSGHNRYTTATFDATSFAEERFLAVLVNLFGMASGVEELAIEIDGKRHEFFMDDKDTYTD